MSQVTRILSQIESGDPAAAELLLPLVYTELRNLAAAKLAHENPGQTLQATALVHEAYLRLVKPGVGDGRPEVGGQRSEEGVPTSDLRLPTSDSPARAFNSRGHFFGAAAEAMRRILVERARQKAGPRRGGKRQRISLDDCDPPDDRPAEILAVHEAIDALAAESPVKADLVKLRYFAGMSHQEAAEALGISRATADRHWAYAKAFLYAALEDGQDG
ncbi:MAG: ECF-type sigma factor [Planctomycetaceae bacterium]|nr:ECF-type sigma factor [Planctomycetaceae bacterium]